MKVARGRRRPAPSSPDRTTNPMDSRFISQEVARRPHLARLIRRRLRPEQMDLVHEPPGPKPLVRLWQMSGCARHYLGVVASEDIELDTSGAMPVLTDEAFALVGNTDDGAAGLVLALAAIAGGAPVGTVPEPPLVQAYRTGARLDRAPSWLGLFLAARCLARQRAGIAPAAVCAADLTGVLALTLTRSMAAALQQVGVDERPLVALRQELVRELSPGVRARLRALAALWPIVQVPPTWEVADIVLGRGVTGIVWPEDDHLPDLDGRWLLHHAHGPLPDAAREMARAAVRPHDWVPGIRLLVQAAGARGWAHVLTTAAEPPDPAMAAGLLGAPPAQEAGGEEAEASATAEAEPAGPESPEAWYRRARHELGRRVTGHADALDTLALTALLHHRGRPARLLITGPPGSGKTHMLRALAEVLDVPLAIVDAQDLSETGFRGLNLGDVLTGLFEKAGRDLDRMAGGVLLIDEIDKVRLPPDTEGVMRAKRGGVQANLLTLFGGGTPIRFSSGDGREGDLEVSTDRMLIVCSGAFAGMGEPTTERLIAWGMLPELVDRLQDRIVLGPRSEAELAQLLVSEGGPVGAVLDAADELGCRLTLPQPTIAYVASAILRSGREAGIRGGMACLAEAARRRLLQALRAGPVKDARLVVAPDDVVLPPWPPPS
jgi:hypothetical protein